MDTVLKEAAERFLDVFEQVFDKDWDYTKEQIYVVDYISKEGTFIDPKVEDETEDWGHRAQLLIEYRKLKDLLARI